jgi:hypothetical protein
MPKRKLLEPSQDTIDEIKKARKQLYVITPEQSDAHAKMLANGTVRKIDSGAYVVQRGKAKKLVFREGPGLGGPDYANPPLTRQIQKAEREFLVEVAKLQRIVRLAEMSKTRARKSLRSKIEQLLRKHGLHNRYACSKIATQLNVDGSYVRKIRNEMRLAEGE